MTRPDLHRRLVELEAENYALRLEKGKVFPFTIPCHFSRPLRPPGEPDGHCKPAAAVYYLPKGCACFPYDQVQALCAQHAYGCTDLGGVIKMIDLEEPPVG